jgi:hypothetical protein
MLLQFLINIGASMAGKAAVLGGISRWHHFACMMDCGLFFLFVPIH